MSQLDNLCHSIINLSITTSDTEIDEAVSNLTEWLHDNPDQVENVDINVLRSLKNGRHFGALKTIADTLIGLGHSSPRIRLLLAQALIDSGSASTAIDILRRIKPTGEDDDTEIETNGLTGRAFKDLYLRVQKKQDSRGSKLMNLAIHHYGKAFDASKETNVWSGENLLALLMRAKNDQVTVENDRNINSIVDRLLESVANTPEKKRDYWKWATLAVVNISQGNWDKAETAFSRALVSKGANAFALGGTIRQLEDWWDVRDQSRAGAGLLAALQAKLLQLQGGNVRLTNTQMQAVRETPQDSFEKIFGAKGPATRQWLLQFLDSGASVGQITKKLGGGVGTCFIVDGGEFHQSLEGERLILTNDHVVSPHPEQYKSNPPLRVNKTNAKFEVFSEQNEPLEVATKEIVWSSGAQDHDACLIRLAEPLPDALPSLSIVRYVPIVDRDSEESVYIIGHPGGRSLAYSMQNSQLIDHDCRLVDEENQPQFIHYVTPTEPGSSGSPALNEDLDVIGLHHAGGKYMRKLDGTDETYPANEAIWIDSICRAARCDLEAGQKRYVR